MNTRTALNIALSSLLRDLDSRHSHPEQISSFARDSHKVRRIWPPRRQDPPRVY